MTTPTKTYATHAAATADKNKLDAQVYYLAHGEYERPDYSVRKLRNADGAYYICAKYYYYAGTLHVRKNGPLLAH
jgi:hypothetical protein